MMIWSEIALIIIGSIIGFVGSILTIIAQKAIDKKGEIKIYYKFINLRNRRNGGWGFVENNAFIVPINFEFQNTSNTTRVIRDVSILLYDNSTKIQKMLQINSVKNTQKNGNKIIKEEEIDYGGDNQAYSFVLPQTSIQKRKCEYAYQSDNLNSDEIRFNRLLLSYYDERDKEHLFFLRDINGDWRQRIIQADCDWFLAKKIK